MKTSINLYLISLLLGIRNVSDKCGRENQNTHFVFSNPPPEYHTFYEIMWLDIIELYRLQMTILRMCIAL